MAISERLLQIGEFARIVNGLTHEEILFELADVHSRKFSVALLSAEGEFVEFPDLDNPRSLTPDELALLVSSRSFGVMFNNYKLIGERSNEPIQDENGKTFNALTRISLSTKNDDKEAMQAVLKLTQSSNRKRLTVKELTHKLTDLTELANSGIQSDGVLQSFIEPLIAEEGLEWLIDHSGSKVLVKYANRKIKPHFDRFGLELTNVGFQIKMNALKRFFKGFSG